MSGELRQGGSFQQAGMGGGVISRCEPPRLLVLELGRGTDEIRLALREASPQRTELELRHATTHDRHEIGGQVYDAIYCMGGGYYPRLLALDRHLRGALPDDYDALAFHLREDTKPAIARGSAAMQALLDRSA